MIVKLPAPIAAYFSADRVDGDAVAQCFTADGRVKDEGHTYAGRDAIRRWKTETSARYDFVSEPFAAATEEDRTVVTSRVTGDFPGSPIDLRYVFTLDGERIASLEIAP